MYEAYLACDDEEDLFDFLHISVDELILQEVARLQPLHEVHHEPRPVRVVPPVVLGLELGHERLLFEHLEVVPEEVEEVFEQEVLEDLYRRAPKQFKHKMDGLLTEMRMALGSSWRKRLSSSLFIP